jgi:hypothetical protein
VKSIKIKIALNGVVHERCVMATVIGAWAVHRPWVEHPSTDGTWTITHVRSGMAIAAMMRIPVKADAVRVARAIDHAVGDCEINDENGRTIAGVIASFRQAQPGGSWRLVVQS